MSASQTLHARACRRAMTLAERRLWALLRRRQTGAKFRRQEPVGPWIAGFLSHGAGLVVEVERDGVSLAESLPGTASRREALARRGFRILCVREAEILENPDAVIAAIRRALATIADLGAGPLPPPSCPPPAGRGEEARRPEGGASLPRDGGGMGRG